MVISKNGKRKRKEPPPVPPVIETVTPAELPKRTKVHAQRKFAQGQGCSTSLSSTSQQNNTTPVKDPTNTTPTEPPNELLPNRRPNTEDFLTFLCFRGTDALPSHLDYFNTNKTNSTSKQIATSSSSDVVANATVLPSTSTNHNSSLNKKSNSTIEEMVTVPNKESSLKTAATTVKSSSTADTQQNNEDKSSKSVKSSLSKRSSSSLPEATSKKDVVKEEKDTQKNSEPEKQQNFIPFAVRKHAETVAEGKRCQTVQALKKKYQEQRIAKTKVQQIKINQQQQSQPPTRGRTTRSGGVVTAIEQESSLEKNVTGTKDQSNQGVNNMNLELVQEHKSDDKQIKVTRNNLRESTSRKNTLRNTPTKDQISVKTSDNLEKTIAKSIINTSIENIASSSGVDVELPLATDSPATIAAASKKPTRAKSAKKEKEFNILPTRMTRQHALAYPESYKKAEEAELNNLLSLKAAKSAAATLASSTPVTAISKKIDEKKELEEEQSSFTNTISKDIVSKNSKEVEDFSSDDDQPLSKTIDTKKKPGGGRLSMNKKRGKKSIETMQPANVLDEKETKNATSLQVNNDKVTNENVQKTGKHLKRRSSTSEASKKLNDDQSSQDSTGPPPAKKNPDVSKLPAPETSTTSSKKKIKNSKLQKERKIESETINLNDESHNNCSDVEMVVKSIPSPIQPQPQPQPPIPVILDPKIGRKIREPIGSTTNVVTNLSVETAVDLDEIKTRQSSGRPMRKTKEAAAIYMELIGQKLNLAEFEEDENSNDSFPELPNVRKTEQMENELKANIGKENPSKKSKMMKKENCDEFKDRRKKKKSIEMIVSAKTNDSTTPVKLEKSFSESDDEPLATKMTVPVPSSIIPTTTLDNITVKSQSITSEPVILEIPKFKQQHELLIDETKPINVFTTKETSDSTTIPYFSFLTSTSQQPQQPLLLSSTSLSAQYPLPTSSTFNYQSQLEHQQQQQQQHQQQQQLSLLQQPSPPKISSEIPKAPAIIIPKYDSTNRITRDIISSTATKPQNHYIPVTVSSPFKTPTFSGTGRPSGGGDSGGSIILASPPISISPLKSGRDDSNRIRSAPSTPTTNTTPLPIIPLATVSRSPPATTKISPAPLQLPIQPPSFATPAPQASPGGETSTQSITAILANLMPSKEESGKIFGIASVTLAQSSGPNDTKCTLGKCGSVHKPPLGPVIPTESLLLNDQMTSKERRKAKVNMTHDQIQKWLTECSVNQDRLEDDLLDEDIDLSVPPKPINYLTTPSPFRDLNEPVAGTSGSGTSAAGPNNTSSGATTTNSNRAMKSKPSASGEKQLSKERNVTAAGSLLTIPKVTPLKAKSILVKEDQRKPELQNYSAYDKYLDERSRQDKQRNQNKESATEVLQQSKKDVPSLSIAATTTVPVSTPDKQQSSLKLNSTIVTTTTTTVAPLTAIPTIDLSVSSPVTPTKSNTIVTTTTTTVNAPITPSTNVTASKKKNSTETVPKPTKTKGVKSTPVTTTKLTATINETPPAVSIPETSKLSTQSPTASPTVKVKSIPTITSASTGGGIPLASVSTTAVPTTPPTPTATATNATTTTKSNAEKKPIYNQKRTPVYNTKLAEPSPKRKAVINTFGAFSPENESSIYSFDKEDDDIAATSSTPFRRQSGRDSKADEQPPTNKKDDKKSTSGKANATKTAGGKKKSVQQQQEVSLTLSPDENAKSASIAVQVSMNQAALSKSKPTAKSTNTTTEATSTSVAITGSGGGGGGGGGGGSCGLGISTINSGGGDGNDSDSDGHTFYIPLQGTNISGAGKSDQLIQGVAVKLGTEGPEGPNQRVIMHAKLVTKSQMGSNTTPIPESMANVHEIVKSLIANKEATTTTSALSGSKSVPVGTVLPRYKSSDVSMAGPSTSANNTSTAAAAAATLNAVALLQQQLLQSTSVGGGPSGAGNQPATSVSTLTRHNSNQSLFSQKSRSSTQKQQRTNKTTVETIIQPSNNTTFPRNDESAQMVEAPTFRPTEKEFQDPMEFFDRIAPIAARFGLCRIIPPASFKPECKISDDMRFTAYNLYVHKMLHRWGPSAKELNAIKKYLATQSITLTHPPWIGGMEVDLPRLYHTVQELGGLKEVIEKKKWGRVAEEMCIPKSAQDRVTKLDDIYCKYLLPYDTLSPKERQKLFDEVEADWAKTEAKARRNADRTALSDNGSNDGESDDQQSGGGNVDGNDDDDDDDDDDDEEEEEDGDGMECIVKGRNMPLNAFFRIARNTMALWFKNTEPTSSEIEAEFWRHVAVRDSHVCVHSGSIDSSGWGYGFPAPGPKSKGSTCSKHPWNLKVLTNNHGSILRSIGPVTGVTVPTLHVGMLFSACCWYRDPHGLPWIEYLHTGGSKIWYGVPDEQSTNFRSAFTSLVPTHCQNKTVWLPCDTAMVPPHMLTDRGVSLCRTEQEPGQFVIVFPRAYTSSLCTGYSISESVYFATSNWLDTAKDDFKDIHDSCEPAMFSLEQLLFAVANDSRTSNETLDLVLPMIIEVYEREKHERELIKTAGVTRIEKIPIKGSGGNRSKKATAVATNTEDDECDICRANLYISWGRTDEDNIYCLQHCIKYLNNERIQSKQCRLIITYSIEEMEHLISRIKNQTSGNVSCGSGGGGSGAGGTSATQAIGAGGGQKNKKTSGSSKRK